MSQGRYSPCVRNDSREFNRNALGQIPLAYRPNESYCQETMFANYDSLGLDPHGYSGYDSEGKYVGIGEGVDSAGFTKYDYAQMTEEEFLSNEKLRTTTNFRADR